MSYFIKNKESVYIGQCLFSSLSTVMLRGDDWAEESDISFVVIAVDCNTDTNHSVFSSAAVRADEMAMAEVIMEVGNIPPEGFDITDHSERIKWEAIEAVWGNIADVRWVITSVTIPKM